MNRHVTKGVGLAVMMAPSPALAQKDAGWYFTRP